MKYRSCVRYLLGKARRGIIVASAMALMGCVHDMQIDPNLSAIRQMESIQIGTNVGYYISTENLEKKVITPGGGGDKIAYKPYYDSEGALVTVLSKAFPKVYALSSLEDSEYIKRNGISIIFIPEIKTDSSSESAFTWPPTEFKLELNCKAVDTNGAALWEKTFQSTGKAEFSEFKADFALAARRASEKAFVDLLEGIIQDAETFVTAAH